MDCYVAAKFAAQQMHWTRLLLCRYRTVTHREGLMVCIPSVLLTQEGKIVQHT